MAVAEADPADARRQALEGDALARHVEPVVQMRVAGQSVPSPWRRSCRCPPDRPRAPPSGTGRCRGRTAGGYRPARSRGKRRRFPSLRPWRPGGCCCHSRASARRRSRSRPWPRHASRIEARAALLDGLRIAVTLRPPLGERPAVRQIAVQRIVRRGLVGDDIGRARRALTSSAGSRRHCRAGRPTSPRRPWSSGRSWRALRRASRPCSST